MNGTCLFNRFLRVTYIVLISTCLIGSLAAMEPKPGESGAGNNDTTTTKPQNGSNTNTGEKNSNPSSTPLLSPSYQTGQWPISFPSFSLPSISLPGLPSRQATLHAFVVGGKVLFLVCVGAVLMYAIVYDQIKDFEKRNINKTFIFCNDAIISDEYVLPGRAVRSIVNYVNNATSENHQITQWLPKFLMPCPELSNNSYVPPVTLYTQPNEYFFSGLNCGATNSSHIASRIMPDLIKICDEFYAQIVNYLFFQNN